MYTNKGFKKLCLAVLMITAIQSLTLGSNQHLVVHASETSNYSESTNSNSGKYSSWEEVNSSVWHYINELTLEDYAIKEDGSGRVENCLAVAYINDDEKTIKVTEFKEPSLLSSPWGKDYPWRDRVNGYKLILEDQLEFIGSDAFMNQGIVGELEIPDSVKVIGEKAFWGCKELEGELKLPDSLTIIGQCAFMGCEGFTGSLNMPDTIIHIDNGVFSGCKGFTGDLIIPSSITVIEMSTFKDCIGLSNKLVIPDSVTTIESEAFCNCTGLTELNIGNGVSNIEDGAFYVKSSLATNINTDNQYISTYDFIEDNRMNGCVVTFYSEGRVVDTQQVARDERIAEPTTLEVPEASGSNNEFEFKGWYTNSEYTEEWDFDTPITTDIELVAKWEVKEKQIRTVTIDPGNGDDVIVQQVTEGEIPILPEVPYKEGYSFDGWYTGENVYDETMPITEDTVIEAHWSEAYETDESIKEKSIVQKLIEALKKIVLLMTISLIPLIAAILFILYIVDKMKKVMILNDKNTDEYKQENYVKVYSTSIKIEGNIIAELLKQEDRVWTLFIPKNIIEERTTDNFKIVLNQYFCKRYNGEQLIVVVDAENKDSIVNYGYVIDREENEILFMLGR